MKNVFCFSSVSTLSGGTPKSSGCNVFDTETITAMDISRKDLSFIAVAGRKSKWFQEIDQLFYTSSLFSG